MQLIATDPFFFVAKENPLKASVLRMNEDLPIHLGYIGIEYIAEKMPFNNLNRKVTLEDWSWMKDVVETLYIG